ncbi:Alpha/beta-hydrolase [Favolaschia claudopus]|uniref:Alpha/beta-hydrolase n=1 Tax=Favolaschia claudopus TaxID=2862362 RepID=A0AAW0CXM2_9AGAR
MLLPFRSSIILALSLGSTIVSASTAPVINTSSGTYVGSHNAQDGTDVFKGIRYAAPPKRKTNALEFGDDCAQAPPLVVAGAPFGPPIQGKNSTEDCLFLNIWRPSQTSSGKFSAKKLPILVYIHGGGLSTGAGSEWDGTSLVRRSVATEEPIIYISINYRLGSLVSSEVLKSPPHPQTSDIKINEPLFVGYRTMQLHLEVMGNGVTISGESAASTPTYSTQTPAALSAEPSLPPEALWWVNTPECTYHDRPGGTYDVLGNLTGCGTGKGSFQCMQNMPFDKFWPLANRIYVTPNLSTQPCKGGKGSLIEDFPINKFLRGDFLDDYQHYLPRPQTPNRPPPSRTSTWAPSPPAKQLTSTTSPKRPSAKSCRSTQTSPTKLSNSSLYNRAAQLETDYGFLAPQRLFLDSALASKTPKRKLWAYEFDQQPPNLPSFLGAFHSVDLYYLNMGFPPIKEGDKLLTTFQDHWISFVNCGEQANKKQVLRLAEGNVGVQADTRQREQTDYLNQVEVLREFGRFGF